MIPKFEATDYDFTEYIPAKNFIGGEEREAESGERFMLIETAEYLREDDPRLAAIAASLLASSGSSRTSR